MSRFMVTAVGVCALAIGAGLSVDLWAGEQNPVVLVQIPYEAPPKQQDVPDVSVPPNTNPLSPEEMTRAEALLPLLEGRNYRSFGPWGSSCIWESRLFRRWSKG